MWEGTFFVARPPRVKLSDFLHRIVPTDPLGWLVVCLGAVGGLLFPAPPEVYKGLFFLVALDTLTGWLVSGKKKTRNSKTFRRKFFPKVIQYLLTITVLYTAKDILTGLVAEEVANLVLGFTLAGIIYTEVKSILENLRALTGTSIRLRVNPQELLDFIEANHIGREDDARTLRARDAGGGEREPGQSGT